MARRWTIQAERAFLLVEFTLTPDDGGKPIEIGLLPHQAEALGRELTEIAETYGASARVEVEEAGR